MSFSETPVIKDRKVLRRLDAAAARSSLGAVLAALAVYAVLCIPAGFYAEHQSLALGFGLAILLISLWRLLLVMRFDSWHGAAPARWRRGFMLGLLAHASLWSALLVTVQALRGMGMDVLMIYLYLLGSAAALSTAWMAALRFRQLVLVVMLVPSALMLLLQGSIEHGVLALLNLLYLVFMLRVYRQQYRLFWHNYNRERRGGGSRQGTLAAASDIQFNLIYRLSHEMRTPMNSIMGMLSLLKETPLNAEQQEYHLHASQASRLMMTLLDDVMDYSRVLSGRLTLNVSVFELRAAFEQSLDAYGSAAQQKGIELNCVMDRHLPRRLQADRERLMQVVNNLLSNAIKFTRDGEVLMQVELVPLSDSEGMLQVVVTDQGPGLSADDIAQLFQDSSLETGEPMPVQRKGFGLLVCKGIAEAMQGNIRVESEPGQGASFRFSARVGVVPDLPSQDPLRQFFTRKPAWVAGAGSGQFLALLEELDALSFNVSRLDTLQQVTEQRLTQAGADQPLLVVDGRHGIEPVLPLLERVATTHPSVRQLFLADIHQRRDPALNQLAQQLPGLQVMVKPVHQRELHQQLRVLYGIPSPVLPDSEQTLSSQEERQGFRVLVVEDNEINQIVTGSLLKKLGYSYRIASSSREALEIMERDGSDVILLDCFLSGEDGFYFIKELRQNPRFRDGPPVIAMTASVEEGVQARCLAAGMNDFLAKPVHLSDLEAMLDFWLHGPTPADDA